MLTSTDGSVCKIDNSNTVPVDPINFLTKPLWNDMYLSEPMATTIDLSGNSTSILSSQVVMFWEDINDPNVRYRENLDIDVKEEAYLRKIVGEYANKFDKTLGAHNIDERGVLQYDSSTGYAIVKLGGRTVKYKDKINGARIENRRLVVNRITFWYDIMGRVEQSEVLGSPAYMNNLRNTLETHVQDLGYLRYDLNLLNQEMSRKGIKIIMNDVNNYTGEKNEEYWRTLCYKFNELAITYDLVTEDIHYFRNKLNIAPKTLDEMVEINNNLPEDKRWKLLSASLSRYHMYDSDFSKNGLKNLKFISYDGIFEAVYNEDKDLLTEHNDDWNMGTYNYVSPDIGLGHLGFDVLPYEVPFIKVGWGNVKGKELPKTDASDNLTRFEDGNTIKGAEAQAYREAFERRFKGVIAPE